MRCLPYHQKIRTLFVMLNEVIFVLKINQLVYTSQLLHSQANRGDLNFCWWRRHHGLDLLAFMTCNLNDWVANWSKEEVSHHKQLLPCYFFLIWRFWHFVSHPQPAIHTIQVSDQKALRVSQTFSKLELFWEFLPHEWQRPEPGQGKKWT